MKEFYNFNYTTYNGEIDKFEIFSLDFLSNLDNILEDIKQEILYVPDDNVVDELLELSKEYS